MLPPIVTLSSLSQAVDAADSPSTISVHTPATAELLSPSTNNTSEQDYFGDRWSTASPRKQNAKGKRTSIGPTSRASPAVSPQTVDRPRSRLPESVYSPRATTFSRQTDRRQSSGYRNRANSTKSTGTTEGDSSASDQRDFPYRAQKRRAPSQKALLSKALAKANHAVVLDGKQNVEGAILAYGDACNLLRQVMVRSSGEDDRRKLEAVVSLKLLLGTSTINFTNGKQRNTYKNRIVELRSSDHSYASSDSKALPERPIERDSGQTELTIVTDEDEEPVIEIAKATPIGHDSGYGSVRYHTSIESPPYIPPRRQSLHSSAYRVEGRDLGASYQNPYHLPSRIVDTSVHLQTPVYEEYMPPPLSPRRPLSPAVPVQEQTPEEESDCIRESNEQHTSWLNTINESSGSSASSVHSRRSSIGLRRKRIRAASGATEAEFDAALDAAIETAYDDGFEPDDEADDDADVFNDPQLEDERPDPLSTMRRNVELAKENVREAEREAAISKARDRERNRLQAKPFTRDSIDDDYGDDEGDEEERMLEEMTRDFVLDDHEYNLQTKSALPRQSDSSGFSGRTWGSIGSNPTTAGTSLSAVAELPSLPSLASQLQENPLPPPVHPPPSGALPPPPAPLGFSFSSQPNGIPHQHNSLASRTSNPGVRERRLSGMKAKQLKIETSTRPYGPIKEAPKTQPPPMPAPMIAPQAILDVPLSASFVEDSPDASQSPIIREPPPSSTTIPSSRKGSYPLTGSDIGEQGSSTASAITKVTSADSDTLAASTPNSPARFSSKATTGLRKNFSSSSLRGKSLSAGDGLDTSPNTSLSSISSAPKLRRTPSPAVPVLPTPLDTSFLPKGQPMGGIYLFDCDIHSPLSPGSPNPSAVNAPLPLEPCPESSLLRPFWFLRAIYQTIAHPRGGYLTSRLFVPRDIWRVKNIKLKNVEEKVSTCDLLTAALLKLGRVDTLNADAVLEEMQFLENVMERAQANLSKKLGNDVGVQGAVAAFKGVNIVDDSASNSEIIKPTSAINNKSYMKSWRKLRSKNSLGPGSTVGSAANASRNDLSQPMAMNSLPMTTSQNPRFPKRDVSQVQCMGPNPSYMGALARLCDATQILGKLASTKYNHPAKAYITNQPPLDQIARQVEDPGLKHSSPTHVGLELCARHAAEFFGFYICRFVFADIGIMLDKFIKRGSEWVLS